jgi:hypothetical protein
MAHPSWQKKCVPLGCPPPIWTCTFLVSAARRKRTDSDHCEGRFPTCQVGFSCGVGAAVECVHLLFEERDRRKPNIFILRSSSLKSEELSFVGECDQLLAYVSTLFAAGILSVVVEGFRVICSRKMMTMMLVGNPDNGLSLPCDECVFLVAS